MDVLCRITLIEKANNKILPAEKPRIAGNIELSRCESAPSTSISRQHKGSSTNCSLPSHAAIQPINPSNRQCTILSKGSMKPAVRDAFAIPEFCSSKTGVIRINKMTNISAARTCLFMIASAPCLVFTPHSYHI